MDIQTAKQIKIADYLYSLGFSPVKQQGINPVSYTHLDVYKRQTGNHADHPTAKRCVQPADERCQRRAAGRNTDKFLGGIRCCLLYTSRCV